jgi:hypothetical protein
MSLTIEQIQDSNRVWKEMDNLMRKIRGSGINISVEHLLECAEAEDELFAATGWMTWIMTANGGGSMVSDFAVNPATKEVSLWMEVNKQPRASRVLKLFTEADVEEYRYAFYVIRFCGDSEGAA